MINVEKVSEGVHYELVVPDFEKNDQAWDVRILEGEFVESILRFGNIAFNGKMNCLNFNFKVMYSPDDDLDSGKKSLQIFAGEILEDILERSLIDGKLDLQDVNDN